MPKPKKINYTGSSKIINALVNIENWLLDNIGTGVTPNPSGTATDNLEKIQIESTIYAIKDTDAIHTADVGAASGVATLDSNGKVPSSQLPSYVDDVVEGYYDSVTDRFYEEDTFTTVIPPTDGKSWVDISTNKSYRWTGSVYVRVDEGVQLGTTHSTAAYGDEGATAYAHSQSDHSTIAPAFSEAGTRANIASGESFATLLGKIKKFFSDLKTVAFTGAYSDLSGTPTIPTVNNSTITIQKNSTTVDSFTLNQSSGKTINIAVPTKTSDLNNDSGYITNYTDEKVTGQEQNPTTGTNYDILWTDGTTNQKPYYNNGFRYKTLQGTASAAGYSIVSVGNSTSTGTAGNKYGQLRIYSQKNAYTDIIATASSTTARTIYLPDESGTFAVKQNISFTLNTSTSSKWYYVLERTYNHSPSVDMIVHVANQNYSNTSGTAKIFLLHMHYHNMYIRPLSCDESQVDWIKNWRITKNETNNRFYLEFQAPALSSGTNNFQITFTSLSAYYNQGITIPSSITESVGTDVLYTYFIDTDYRAIANSEISSWAKASTKPSYNFGEIGAGIASIGDGANGIKWRTNSAWTSGVYYQTTGDESVVFCNKNERTSWMFAYADLDTRPAWNAITPSLQIKNGKVAINKLIANSAYLTYALEVNGDVQATNFRGALVGNADTATKATQDGDGNTISSTYLKLAGGTMTGTINSQSIVPTTNNTYNLGSSDYRFMYGYIRTRLYLGKGSSTGDIDFGGTISTTLKANSTAPSSTCTIYLPNTSGTLVTDIAYGTGSIDTSKTGWALYRFGKMRVLNLTAYTNSVNTINNFFAAGDRPTRLVQVEGMGWSATNKQAISIIVISDGRLAFVAMTGSGIVPNSVRGTVVWSVD